MQNHAKAELEKTFVESVHIDVDSDCAGTEYTLNTTGKAELRVPKDEDDPTFMMVTTMNIVSPEQPQAINIKLVATFFFKLDQLVDDYDEIIREQCLPHIQRWQKKMLNKLLVDIGFPEIFPEPEEE